MGVGVGIGVGVSKKFNVKVFYVMGKALSGELSCPCDRSCLLYSLIIHSAMNLFSQHSRQFILSFPKSLRREKLCFHSFNMAIPATFFANFPVNKHPSTSKVIRR